MGWDGEDRIESNLPLLHSIQVPSLLLFEHLGIVGVRSGGEESTVVQKTNEGKVRRRGGRDEVEEMKTKGTNEVEAKERVAMACRGRAERESLNMVGVLKGKG